MVEGYDGLGGLEPDVVEVVGLQKGEVEGAYRGGFEAGGGGVEVFVAFYY